MKKLTLFGAGKIGRSFIAQLFSRSGYEVVFVDINKEVINALTREGRYRVVVKSYEGDETIWVENVRGVLAFDTSSVAEETADADILAMSVGINAIPKVVPLIAGGLKLRAEKSPDHPLDIILAENLRDAAKTVKEMLKKHLPASFDINNLVGLVETSIGKMVPIMPEEVVKKDPLLVFAEPYNSLILDKNGFKNAVPEVKGLVPKENMAAWVDRKSFIHNFGHVAAAYYGYSKYPHLTYMYEILEKKEIRDFTRSAMKQAAEVLMKHYPGEFTPKDLEDHIDDLLSRFANKALGDTVFRVGQDLYRKLGPEDRIAGVLKLALKYNLPYDKILDVLKYAMKFKASDMSGKRSDSDIEFSKAVEKYGAKYILNKVCKLDEIKYSVIYKQIN